MTTKENIIIKYKHTILFYVLATIIPWAFWFTAGYVSHHTVYSESKWAAPILGIIGLCFPMLLTIALVYRSPNLRADFFGRFFNFSKNKWWYYIAACLLLPASILCAMAISLLFGYSPPQFVVTGHYLRRIPRLVSPHTRPHTRRTCLARLWHRQPARPYEPVLHLYALCRLLGSLAFSARRHQGLLSRQCGARRVDLQP